MKTRPARRLTGIALIVAMTSYLSAVAFARAGDDLKTIHFAGVAQIMYGPLPPGTAEKKALGEMLHKVHEHFGERPQVGKLFRDKNAEALDTYFNVTASKENGRHYSGLVIVSLPKGGQPKIAAIYDDAQQFPASANKMLQRLQQEWTSAPAKSSAKGGSSGAGVPPLQTVNFPDGSGSVDLPDGWKLVAAQKGKMDVLGPNGEKMMFGQYLPVIDPSRGQALIQMETGNGRKPMPGLETAVPYGDDPVEIFKAISAQLAERQHRQAPGIEVTKVTKLPSQGPGNRVILMADVDAHDGKGVMAMTALISTGSPNARGLYSLWVNQVNIPKELSAKESPITGAISRSVKINSQVIEAENAQDQKARAAFTDAVLARGKAIQDANDAQHAAVRAKWDNDDKQSQAFQNYTFDRSVIKGNDSGGHTTVDNDYANYLVAQHPDQFQYVPTQDYLKGVDY